MLHIVLRTCDRESLESDRIVNKRECVKRCFNSLLKSLEPIGNKHLHVIDDCSSEDLKLFLKEITKDLSFVSFNFLEPVDQTNLSKKKKSRRSVQVAYNYIYSIPDSDLVYVVEDDYLHFNWTIEQMLDSWSYFKEITNKDVGIFPHDFNQLYFHPLHEHNRTYVTDCMVVPHKNRYYRTTWFTHESFLIQSSIFKKFKDIFDSLLTIGDEEHIWEGNTISKVWQDPSFLMFMPLGTMVIHMSNSRDIPFFITRETVNKLWDENKTIWSSVQDSQVLL